METKLRIKLIFFTIISALILSFVGINVDNKEIVQATSNVVEINNDSLRTAVYSLLNKKSTEKLYSDDFLNSEKYKATTTTNPDTGIETTTAQTYFLDFSNTKVTDIIELCQFEFPSTLSGINLSYNGITNDDLSKITTLLELNTTTDTYTYNEETLKIRSNFDEIIKAVNLTFNNINLDTINETDKDNTKLLYGVQNFTKNQTNMYLPDELTNVKYFIRSNDQVILSYNFKTNGTSYNFSENAVASIFNDGTLGDFEINISNHPDTPTGYFNTLDLTEKFIIFTIKINPTFTVERTTAFNLKQSDLIIDGIWEDEEVIIYNASTKVAGTGNVPIKIKTSNYSRELSLPFTIIDTVKPTIELDQPAIDGIVTTYWRQNKSFEDPGFKGLDSGEDITHLVEHTEYNTIKIDTIGSYDIVYTLKDTSGNTATSITRRVIIQQQVLDEIVIRTNETNFVVGQDILLIVQPAEGIDTTKYTDYQYSWYLNGFLFQTTTGDFAGKSSVTINIDNTNINTLEVKLHAKQKTDGKSIFVDSNAFTIEAQLSLSNDTTLIIALVSALVLVIGVVITTSIINAKKAKKTNRKSNKGSKKSGKSSSNNSDDNIKIIKDYQPPKE